MKRIALSLAYDGTHFYGYQIQPEKRTVQGVVEEALMKLHKGNRIRVYSSGRTDTGVHARSQIIHFDTPLNLQERQWEKALNSLLPDDVIVMDVAYAPQQFHARFQCKEREYRYRLLRSKKQDVFRRNITYHYPYPLSLEAMREAAHYIIGTHDFSAFCSSGSSVENKVRTIYDIEISEEGDELIFKLRGNGFLHNMVRIIVGTLLEVGAGKREPSEMELLLAKKDRTLAGKTVPGHGLILWDVKYDIALFDSKKS